MRKIALCSKYKRARDWSSSLNEARLSVRTGHLAMRTKSPISPVPAFFDPHRCTTSPVRPQQSTAGWRQVPLESPQARSPRCPEPRLCLTKLKAPASAEWRKGKGQAANLC